MILLVTVSIPILLPEFAGHRLSWLLFLVVLAVTVSLLAVPYTWLTKRLTALGTTGTENRVARAVVGLMLCCLAGGVLFHYAALRSDTVFLLLTVPALFAVWFGVHQWHTLFIALADKLHLSKLTCIMISTFFLAIGLALQHFLDRHLGNLALYICILAALGCFRTHLPRETQTPE